MEEKKTQSKNSPLVTAISLCTLPLAALMIPLILLSSSVGDIASAVKSLHFYPPESIVTQEVGEYLDETQAREFLGLHWRQFGYLLESGTLNGTYVTFTIPNAGEKDEDRVFSKTRLQAWMEAQFVVQLEE